MMEAVFIKVLNMSISAGWLILAVMLLRLLLKKAPKWISVVLWGLVGLRLVFPFSLQSVLSLIPSAEVISPSIGYAQHPEINSGVSVIDNAVNPTLGTSLAATPMNSVNPMQIVLYLGGLVWVGGIVILLLYGLISYLRLRRKVTEAIPYEKNTWLCDQVKTPFILGVFRPRIYLPSGLNEKETAYVLAHERAHLKRKDHLWKPLGFLLLTVYWFNPLVWVAYILLCRDIEAACDEKVISDMAMAEKKAYANALVSCSMQRRLILACPLAFGEVGVKERVKGVLNYRKPAFWIIVAALIACAVIAVCFLTNPKDDGPDLSFLNYKNAIPLIGQNDTAPYANLYPADSDGVQLGVADAKALAQFLGSAEWTKRRAPSSSPEPRGYLEFLIEDDYRIIVYQSERLAAVRFGNNIRYYRIGAGDYEAALAAFIPAPSTEPDRVPEQTFDTELILSDPLTFLLSFSNAEIVTLIDNTGRSYEESGKSFHEIISSQTWTAQAIQGFTTVEPSRQIYLRGDDYWCLSFEQTVPDSEMTCCAHNLLSSQSMLISFDCGENLMDELMAWAIARQDGAHSGPMPYKLTAEEEEQIVYMLSEVAGKTGPYALSDYTGGDMNAVPELCMQLQYYARDHRLSADQMRGLMRGTQGLDGAYAEGYAALLAELHALDPLRFVAAYFQADESVQPFLWELYGNLDHIYPPEELAREYAAFSQIYNNMTAYLRTEYGLKYENLAPKLEDMQLYRCGSMPKEPVNWFFEDVSPNWAVQVTLDHAGNSKPAVGVLTVYFGSPDGYTDNLPLGAYLESAPASAFPARLAVRLNDSSLAYIPVPAELAERIEHKMETGSELPGIKRVRMDGWGEQYAQGVDVPDLYYYPAYDRDRSTYLTILRNADGQYGIDSREADEEIRALLTLLQRETGWNVFSDPTDFTDLTQIDVFFCGTPLTSVRDEAHLDAFEELISEGSFASYASKTPNEIVEIRCTRADGSTVTLATDPVAARFWLPPFNYYRYDAYEQEPRTGALLKALGLDGWPSMDTVDLGAVREMNERLLPTPEGWKSAYGGNISHVETHEVESAIYSQEDIGAAIELIEGEFQRSWSGCTLTEIYYAGDEYTSDYQDWADRTGADEVIVLLSSFDVDSSGGDGSLNPNSTYDRWNWILVRTYGGEWKHVDHGY